MLEFEHLERVAKTFRNLAATAPHEDARREMLAAAADYQRRAGIRRKSVAEARALSEKK